MPTAPKSDPVALTVPQVAALLQIGINAAYDLCHRSDLPALRIGRSVRINRDGLQRWLDENNGGGIL